MYHTITICMYCIPIYSYQYNGIAVAHSLYYFQGMEAIHFMVIPIIVLNDKAIYSLSKI